LVTEAVLRSDQAQTIPLTSTLDPFIYHANFDGLENKTALLQIVRRSIAHQSQRRDQLLIENTSDQAAEHEFAA
jgi:hypothetical protein